MNAQDVVDRLTLARERMEAELISVRQDIGSEWDVSVSPVYIHWPIDDDLPEPLINLEAKLVSRP